MEAMLLDPRLMNLLTAFADDLDAFVIFGIYMAKTDTLTEDKCLLLKDIYRDGIPTDTLAVEYDKTVRKHMLDVLLKLAGDNDERIKAAMNFELEASLRGALRTNLLIVAQLIRVQVTLSDGRVIDLTPGRTQQITELCHRKELPGLE